MPRKKKRKFINFTRVNEPSSKYLYVHHSIINQTNNEKILTILNDQFFNKLELDNADGSGKILERGYFNAQWSPLPTDPDKNEAPIGSYHVVMARIDENGIPIGSKVEAPNPPFTDDGIV